MMSVSQSVIALPKKNRDVQHVAIAEVLRRTSAKALCYQLKAKFANFFAPIQHGVATEGGSELVTHNVQLLLDANPDWVLLQTDMSNAFNSVSRSHLLDQVTEHFLEILRHCFQMYYNLSDLVYNLNGKSVFVISEEGIQQGDPLGLALSSLAIRFILVELQTDHDKVIYLAYLDKISILGPAEPVIDAGIALKNALLPINLSINDKKYTLLSKKPLDVPHCPFPVSILCKRAVVLGTSVCEDDYIMSICESIAQSANELCPSLSQIDDPQSALLLLCNCHVPSLCQPSCSFSSTSSFSFGCLHS